MNITINIHPDSSIIEAIVRIDATINPNFFIPLIYKGIVNLINSAEKRFHSLEYNLNPNSNGIKLFIADNQDIVETNLDRDSALDLIKHQERYGIVKVKLQFKPLS